MPDATTEPTPTDQIDPATDQPITPAEEAADKSAAETPPEKPVEEDFFVTRILRDMGEEIKPVPEEPIEPEAPPKVEETPPATPAEPPPAKADETPPAAATDDDNDDDEPAAPAPKAEQTPPPAKTAEKPKAPPARATPVELQEISRYTPAIPRPPSPDPDAEYVASLNPAQQIEIEEAEVAEKRFPGKYAGLRAKIIGFYKAMDKKVDEFTAASPNRSFGEDDEEFQAWLKSNKPRLSTGDTRVVQVAYNEERAVRAAQERLAPEIQEIRRSADEVRLRPHVTRVANEVVTQAINMLEGEYAEAIRKDGLLKAGEQYPAEIREVVKVLKETEVLSQRFTALVHKVEVFDTAKPDPVHLRIAQILDHQSKVFAAHGGPERIRIIDGVKKTFLPRPAYNATKAPERSKFWTFSDDEVLDILAYNAVQEVNTNLSAWEKEAAARGYERKPRGQQATTPKPTKAKGPEPKPINPPKSKVTPAPGAAKSNGVNGQPASNDLDVVRILGLEALMK